MTAARVALVLAVVVSAMQSAEAEPCAPRAELGGDAEAVTKVAAELQRLGVDTSDTGAKQDGRCSTIVAVVEVDPSGGIDVAVRDGAQRSEGRLVSDAALAAAWIDSWLRDDFTAGVAEPPPLVVAPPVRVAETTAPVAVSMLDRFSLAASFVQAWSDDSSSWSGVAASACVRAGELCLGARVTYVRQTITADLTAAAKQDLSLLATASYSQELGRMSVAPELGLGIDRLTTERIEGCKPEVMDPNCNPMDPTTCTMQLPAPCTTDPGVVYVGDGFATATVTPRISAAIRIAIPLFDHVWLDGLAAATVSPFGHASDYQDKEIGADGTTMNVAGYPLPGDPLLGVQLGIGLRLGAR